MKYLSAFLLVGVLWLTLFGVFSVHAGMQDHDGGCVAAITQGLSCPQDTNIFNYLSFHLDAIRGFLYVIFSENISLLLASMLFVVTLFFATTVSGNGANALRQNFLYVQDRRRDTHRLSQKHKLIHWLALHENSPCFS